jgi:hypothetical protein
VTSDFAQLAGAIPWLAELPASFVPRIDWTELILPRGGVQAIRQAAEQALGAHVITYRRAAAPSPPGKLHLCQVLAPSRLSPDGLAILARAESELAEAQVVLCAYARPLRLSSILGTTEARPGDLCHGERDLGTGRLHESG